MSDTVDTSKTNENSTKGGRIRTSITIEPNLLDKVRTMVNDGKFASVSAAIEHALVDYFAISHQK